MASWQYPQTPVLNAGVVERDPGTTQAAITGWNEPFILVPGLPRFASRLCEEHGLHTLDASVPPRTEVSADNLAHHCRKLGMAQIALNHWTYHVRLMNAHQVTQDGDPYATTNADAYCSFRQSTAGSA